MISAKTAAGLVCGMLQTLKHTGEAIDALTEHERSLLLHELTETIMSRTTLGPAEVATVISRHPVLGPLWARLISEIGDAPQEAIRAILRNCYEDALSRGHHDGR